MPSSELAREPLRDGGQVGFGRLDRHARPHASDRLQTIGGPHLRRKVRDWSHRPEAASTDQLKILWHDPDHRPQRPIEADLTTNDANIAARAKRLRNGGQTDRYHHGEFGVNSRLDEIQAAILRARLQLLPGWTLQRRELAAKYRRRLATATTVTVPPELDDGHVYHLFPVRSASREAVQATLRAAGVETLIHYPVPIPKQPALASEQPSDCPIANRVCDEILSLPLYPSLPPNAIDVVAEALLAR